MADPVVPASDNGKTILGSELYKINIPGLPLAMVLEFGPHDTMQTLQAVNLTSKTPPQFFPSSSCTPRSV